MLIREISKKSVEVKLYGNIGGWFANGETFTSMIQEFEGKYETLIIREHCFGGSVFEGNVIYNALLNTSLKVYIFIDGIAASMGCFILPAVEDVFIADNGFGMIHRPNVTADGDADDLENSAKLMRNMEENFIKRLHERTGMAEDEIKAKWFDGHDHWLNADEMVQFGLAKKVVPATAKNIKQLDAAIVAGMTINGMYDRYAAVLDKSKSINSNNKNSMDKQLLITTFGLEGVTAESSDTAVLAALQAKQKKNEDRISELEAQAKAKQDAQIKALLDQAKTQGKFVASAGQKIDDIVAMYEQIGQKSGVEALATVLAGMGTRSSIAQSIVPEAKGGQGGNGAAGDPKTFEDLTKLGDSVLAEWKTNRKEDYNRLYKAEFGHEPTC